ncbi:sulfite exporter TauE/SafE family protein [Undibacterium sp. RTI2.1]|uniref:sulfite exporter TauE/SafE family protein n=1 Tax=unclassified Undibacterium TaxID=2630295 RepID=UPI002AB439FD|nr:MULTISPECIES: sulfite exporter TauE/SafE family protein [unclassified Undibacterium]MDY7538304.1 sulfite exporter TauE/SafE family protein [Undibacterium sp. 5I1]MEB0031514.1 sulfite exporter TauE/SafE family protein [Undibacterium sp. RTI2.1]MEB0115072.1 sulfite exporter TauE/SafE family protein [Undibacterium sp. RTI2.2]MEB0229421.1 sulfite exporter TauE/SafE family protein [Undibacterium sp. 10I3]MEB0256031.1 sulfite exporter TauE/SafE family protein [Undibacterium sp. 5I1]
MTSINLLPVFLTGLIGSVHCVGMCGGIVGAFSMASSKLSKTGIKKQRVFPLRLVSANQSGDLNRMSLETSEATTATAAHASAFDYATRAISYNSGRISSYMLAGVIAGSVGSGLLSLFTLSTLTSLQNGFYWMANFVLLAIGLYMMDIWRGISKLELLGQSVWRRISPLTRRLLPLDSNPKAFAMGALWGWLPCGMVYSILFTAMLSGSAYSGAMVMLAFGLGTLPTLLLMAAVGSTLGAKLGIKLKSHLQNKKWRLFAGSLLCLFGLLGLFRAFSVHSGQHALWLDAFCINPPAPNTTFIPITPRKAGL